MPKPDRGFVYVATGDTYVQEAARSARSVRRFHSEPICLVTDRAVPAGHPFDEVMVRPELPRTVASKLKMSLCPYRTFIFLDSDTRVIAPLDELFQLLEAFDVCVPASLGGYHYTLEGVSPAYREPSTNVIGYRRGPALDEFFVRWEHYYQRYESVMGREWDQRSFRHASYETKNLRICFLGDEWSLSPYPGGLLCRDVRILHGRPEPIIDEMEAAVNQPLGYRVFWRGFAMIPEKPTFRQGVRLGCQFFVAAFKAAGRPIWRWVRGR